VIVAHTEELRKFNEHAATLTDAGPSEREKKLVNAARDLLEQVESLNGYELTRDIDRYKAEACWEDAQERAHDALAAYSKADLVIGIPQYLARRGMRTDGTLPLSDDDEPAADGQAESASSPGECGEPAGLLARIAAQQARIDALMLEYCPEEMTVEQMTEWRRNQKVAEPSTPAGQIEGTQEQPCRARSGPPTSSSGRPAVPVGTLSTPADRGNFDGSLNHEPGFVPLHGGLSAPSSAPAGSQTRCGRCGHASEP